jgi:chromate transport protein ChrA
MLGQITPGPWTVSIALIGYKLSNLLGAVMAVSGLFFPSLVLVFFSTKALNQLKSLPATQVILTGIRPVIIGMIYYAAWVVGKGIEIEWNFIVIFLTTLGVLQFTRLKYWWFNLPTDLSTNHPNFPQNLNVSMIEFIRAISM